MIDKDKDKDNVNDIEDLNKQKSINLINKLNDSEDLNINNNNNNILLNSLFKLIEENNINELESNLIKDDSVINTLGDNGLSLLHFSVIKGNLPIINTLLKYGANPNILSEPNQQTSLHLAYLSQEPNRENIINVLLNYKANNNIIDIYNNRPSDYNKNNNINENNLNTPDKKNKIKKEDIYYKINDININFFNTSDIKRKSSNKKNKKDKIKCNCIFTPKKNQITDSVVDSQKIENDYNLSDFKNININFNDNFNFNEKDNNENDVSDTYSNNKLQIKNKEINIYQLNNNNNNSNSNNIDNNIDSNDTNEKICVEKNNTVFYNKEKEKENYETNILNINDCNNELNNENNFENDDELNDSLEEEDKVNNNKNFKDILKSFENINNNMDELFKTIIANKRKSIAERSSHKKRKMSNYSNFTSFPKGNIFFNYSNNSCSTQNQTSQKKMSNITKEKSKTTSEFKCNYKNIKRNEDNYNNNNIINNENNMNDNIIQKIIDNRNKFKNWLLDINLPYYYEKFIENNIYGIDQLVDLYNSKEPNELFQILISILKTKKYGHIYKIISKIEMDINIIDSKLIDFMISNTDEKSRDMKLSISGGRSVICGKKNEEQNLLKLFLNKYNLSQFYQNFCHNGFDEIEYVIIQMYGKASINDFVLENYLHIYDKEERKNVLEALIKEVENINKFINSEEYLNKVGIKYENIMYENKGGIHFIISNNNNKCNLCLIY